MDILVFDAFLHEFCATILFLELFKARDYGTLLIEDAEAKLLFLLHCHYICCCAPFNSLMLIGPFLVEGYKISRQYFLRVTKVCKQAAVRDIQYFKKYRKRRSSVFHFD